MTKHLPNADKKRRDALIVRRHKGGESMRDLAKAFDVSVSLINKIILGPGHVRKVRVPRAAVYAAMVEEYLGGDTLETVGQRHGVTREWVRQVLNMAGVTMRHHGESSPRRQRGTDLRSYFAMRKEASAELREWNNRSVRADYDAGMTYRTIAAKYGKTIGWVIKVIQRSGGPTKNRKLDGPVPRYNLTDEQKLDLAFRYAVYEPVASLREEFGVSSSYICNNAQKLGFARGIGPGVYEHFQKKLRENKRGR